MRSLMSSRVLAHNEGAVVGVGSAWDKPFRDTLLVHFHGTSGERLVVLVVGYAHPAWVVRS